MAGRENINEDNKTLVDLSSAHFRSQAKCLLVQTSLQAGVFRAST